jgi:hypothetical protein
VRVAGHSCLAGPSVYSTLYDPRRCERLHPLSLIEGTKNDTEAAWHTSAAADACKTERPSSRMVALRGASSAHAPVTPLISSRVRELPRDCKGFCVVSGLEPKRGSSLRAREVFHPWQNSPVRGTQERPARPAAARGLAGCGCPVSDHEESARRCRQVGPGGVSERCHGCGKHSVTPSQSLPLVGAYDCCRCPRYHL